MKVVTRNDWRGGNDGSINVEQNNVMTEKSDFVLCSENI